MVSVRGAPRVGPEVERRAKAEAQAVLLKLLEAARADGATGSAPDVELSAFDVANRGVFVLLLTGPDGSALDSAGSVVQTTYSSLAAAVSAGTAADDGFGFQYCDKILPIQHQLTGSPTASGISEAVRTQLELAPPAPDSSVAVLIHARGDDVHGAAERGGTHLTTVEAREAVLQATVGAGCGVDLQVRSYATRWAPAPLQSAQSSLLVRVALPQSPDWAVVVTMWRAAGSEAAAAGIALVPGVSIRTKPRLAPVRLPRPKVDPAATASKSKALKRRVQPDSGTSGGNTEDGKSEKKKVAAPVKLSVKDATTLLRAALVRRAELLALVQPVPAPAARSDDASAGSGAGISNRNCDCWRLVHGTGDGFDGLTSDVLGLDNSGRLRVLVEAHHKWADPAPLIVAIRSLAEEGLLPHATETQPSRATQETAALPTAAVYLKMRFLADARQSGGLLAEGSTELPVPTKHSRPSKEQRKKAKLERHQTDASEEMAGGAVDAPSSAAAAHAQEDSADPLVNKDRDEGSIVCSENGLKFELSITRGEHIGLFFDSRTARAKVRELAAGRRVLNLFAFTGGTHRTVRSFVSVAGTVSACHAFAEGCWVPVMAGMGVAAAAGGAKSTTNVDNKLRSVN